MSNRLSVSRICLAATLLWTPLHLFAQVAALTVASPAIVGYQLQPDLSYQPLTSATALSANFCPHPRPDTVPIQLTDSSGKPQWLQLSNEGGNLRWFGATTAGVLLAGSSVTTTEALPELDGAVVAPPLLLTKTAQASVSKASTDVIWHDPVTNQYQRADLSNLQAPRLLWRWSPPARPQSSWMQTPVLHWLQNQQPVLMVNSATAAKPALWLVQANSGKLAAEFDLERHYRQGMQPDMTLAALKAAPAALDLDGDGAFDRVYQIDEQGQLLRLDIEADFSYQTSRVADLSGEGFAFVSPLLAVRAMQPQPELGTAMVSHKPVDVLVLLGKTQNQHQLMVLFLAEHISAPLRLNEIRLLENAAPLALSAAASGKAGSWRQALPGQPLWMPEIIAGVLYLPLQSTQRNKLWCAEARQADLLLARHLYQGDPVYSVPVLSKAMQLPLRLAIGPAGSLQLQQSSSGAAVLEALRGATPACAACTEPLTVEQLSQWRQLATYRQEEVY